MEFLAEKKPKYVERVKVRLILFSGSVWEKVKDKMSEQYWTLRKALLITITTLTITISIGIGVGYLFFWDNFDDRSVFEKQLEQMGTEGELTPDLLVEKAWLTFKQGNDEQALAYLQEAIAKDKSKVAAHYNLGLIHLQRGRFEEATKAFSKTIALDKSFFWGYLGLGQSYVELGEYAKAVENLRKAEELDGKAADVHYYLGKALEGSGAEREAIAAYRRALEYVPNYAEAKAALKRLKVDGEKG